MRTLLSAVALLLAAAPALAGGAEDFFLGRPPSVGVVRGGAFGADGADYLGEVPVRPVAAPRTTRSARRVAHAGRVRQGGEPTIVARPYFRP